MNEAEIEPKVLALFMEIAPDVEPAKLSRDLAFRDQFDFDSMDTLNFAIALSESFSIDVPETAYRRLASLAKAVDYVREQLAHKG